MGFRRALAFFALFAAAPAGAQEPEAKAAPDDAPTAMLIVYGDDPCPPSQGDEIVVCARQPEEERYRLPRALRERRDRRSETSWGARAADLEEASRPQRPDSCSVVGTGGQTGCSAAAVRDWSNVRRARRRERERRP